MKRTSAFIKPGVKEIVYTSEVLPLKVRKIFDSITNTDFIYIIPGSGIQYAITEECADDIIKSMTEEKI